MPVSTQPMENIQSHLASLNPNPEMQSNHKSHSLQNQARILGKLRDNVVQFITNGTNISLPPHQITLIEERLRQVFPFVRTPTHPAYASMIYRAITDLNEEGGSSEESISEYILAKFEDLPWAHETYLSHHLNKLSVNGEIVCTSSNCYLIPGLILQPNPAKGEVMKKRGRETGENVIQEETMVEYRITEVNGDHNFSEEENIDVSGKRNMKQGRKGLVVYDEDEVTEVEADGIERENVVRGCEVQVVEEQGEERVQEVSVEESKLEKCDHESLEARAQVSLDEQHSMMAEGRTSPDDWQIVETVRKFSAKKQLTDSVAAHLSLEECQGEVGSGMLSLDHHYDDTKLIIVPYDSGSAEPAVKEKRKRTILPAIECVLVCGLETKMLEQPKILTKNSHWKRKLICQSTESVVVSSDSLTSQLVLEHEQEHGHQALGRSKTKILAKSRSLCKSSNIEDRQAGGSGVRKISWQLVKDESSNRIKIFHTARNREDKTGQRETVKVLNLENSVLIEQSVVEEQQASGLQLEKKNDLHDDLRRLREEMTSHELEPPTSALREEHLAPDDQHCQQQRKQLKKPGRKSREGSSCRPESGNDPTVGSRSLEDQDKQQQQLLGHRGLPGSDPQIAACSEQAFLSDDHPQQQQQVKQPKKRGRKKRLERLSIPGSGPYPVTESFTAIPQHEQQKQYLNRIVPCSDPQTAPSKDLSLLSDGMYKQQQLAQPKTRGQKRRQETLQGQIPCSPVSGTDPRTESVFLEDCKQQKMQGRKKQESHQDQTSCSPVIEIEPMVVSISLQGQHEQQELVQELSAYGSEPQTASHTKLDLPSDNQNYKRVQNDQQGNQQFQSLVGSSDAEPLPIFITEDTRLPSVDQHPQLLVEKSKYRGRGRPPRRKPETNSITVDLASSQHQQQDKVEGHLDSASVPCTIIEGVVFPSNLHHQQQVKRLERRRRGRPPKRKPVRDTEG
ncbi:hypothetical protein Ancab_021176 [Ancistrocladus abbreviatus]